MSRPKVVECDGALDLGRLQGRYPILGAEIISREGRADRAREQQVRLADPVLDHVRAQLPTRGALDLYDARLVILRVVLDERPLAGRAVLARHLYDGAFNSNRLGSEVD